jgi:hypothetical protein
MDTLSGSVERITFYKRENGYTVLRLKPDSHLGQRSIPSPLFSLTMKTI